MAAVKDSVSPRAIFLAAIMLPDEQIRTAYLDQVCGDDSGLRQRVDDLLAAQLNGRASPLEHVALQLNIPQAVCQEVTGETHVPHANRVNANSPSGSSAKRAEFDLSIQPQIGPYKLLEQIGQGGFGTVYMADQTAPVKRRVALKVLKPGMDSREVIARFEAERQALAMMDHPNIARVLDGGTSPEGRPYFVMELVRGVPITEYCDEARFSNEERLRLFVDVCRAVQHAHLKGIIHRDLKPSNVLVTMHDDKAVPKVIDFGIAKAVNQKLTDRTLFTGYHQLLGTPMYMSPEQAQMSGIDVDTRSDVYSLGVLLYELLTGTTPFTKESLSNVGFDELRRIIREQEPARPSTRLTTLDAQARSTIADRRRIDQRQISNVLRGELDWIVMKALEKDRTRRYESASALAADIERYFAGEAVEASPPSKIYRLRKFAGRYRIALATAATIAAVLVAGVVGTTWQMLRAMTAERVAETATKEVRSESNRARAEAARANEQRRRAEDERQRAIDNLKLARSIVDSLYLQVGTQWIADETAPSNFQKGILKAAVRFYEKLTETQVTSPGNLSELSLVSSGYGRIGVIQHYLQNYEDAVEARRKTVEVVRQGLAVEPRNPAIRSAASEIYYEVGQSLVELARFDEAVEAFDESSAAAGELVGEQVDPIKHRYWLARADLARAAVHARIGSSADAIRLARAAKDGLEAVSKQADSKQVYWGELNIDRRRADYWAAKSLACAGDLVEAAALTEQALASCRRQRNIQQDDARLRTLEIDFLELSAELAGLKGDLPAAAEQYRSVLDMRLKSLRAGLAPGMFFTKAVFTGSINMDGLMEPGPFCGYVETHLRLAEVLRRAGRPYAAEDILGECLNVTVSVVAERPNALRYRIADANTWVLAAELLAERRPTDAETAYRRARQLWTKTIEQFPHAKHYVSGIHGHQTDWERFQGVGHLFSNVLASESEDKEVNTQETVFHQHSWSARSWARAGSWKAAIGCFNRSAELRTQISDHDHAYDWLQLAMAHAQLGEHDQALSWLDKAQESITHLSEPHVELIELRDEARSVVERNRSGSDPGK